MTIRLIRVIRVRLLPLLLVLVFYALITAYPSGTLGALPAHPRELAGCRHRGRPLLGPALGAPSLIANSLRATR